MDGMSLIVKTVTRWLKGFLLLFGIYIVLYGHLTPGGGFCGGVIIGSVFILLTLAEGKKIGMKTLSKSVASEMDSVGALAFLGIAAFGMYKAGIFFKNFIETQYSSHFKLFSAGIIPLCNIVIGLKVGTSLFMVFLILAAIRIAVSRPEKTDNSAREKTG